jgi:hypothetical protein
LRQQLNHALFPQSVTYICEKANCFKWLSSKLRIVIGRDVSIKHLNKFHAIRRELVDNTPDLIFLEVDDSFEGALENCLRQINGAGYISSVIVLAEFLPFSRQVDLMKMGIGGVIHKDDAHVSAITEVILQSLDAPRRIPPQAIAVPHAPLACPCPA